MIICLTLVQSLEARVPTNHQISLHLKYWNIKSLDFYLYFTTTINKVFFSGLDLLRNKLSIIILVQTTSQWLWGPNRIKPLPPLPCIAKTNKVLVISKLYFSCTYWHYLSHCPYEIGANLYPFHKWRNWKTAKIRKNCPCSYNYIQVTD